MCFPPPQPLDDQVVLGRALCKVFLIECKTCLRHVLLNQQTLAAVTDIMTHVDHHYVLNRHNSGPTMQLLPDFRNMLITRRLDDILYLIPLAVSITSTVVKQHSLTSLHALLPSPSPTTITGDTSLFVNTMPP